MQLDVADFQKIDGVEIVAEYKPNDNAIELLKVPPSNRSLYQIPIPSPHTSITPPGGDHAQNGRDLRIQW